jgi:hypothetical protein
MILQTYYGSIVKIYKNFSNWYVLRELNSLDQCSGSGSEGSICFWAIRILPSTSKKVRKTLISIILLLLFDFLFMKVM